MDMRDYAATCDGGLYQVVELLVASDSELQVARRDALHLEVLRRVSGELEHLGREILENRCAVDRRVTAHFQIAHRAALEVAMDAADRELFA